MSLWKLGCRWGSNTPLFYDFIKNHNIVIGWIDKDYEIGDWLLITNGYTVLALARVVSSRENVLNKPDFQLDFDKLQIPFDENLFIYNAQYVVLNEADRFSYSLQQGICRVQSNDIKKQFNSLLQKYGFNEMNTSIIDTLSYKHQIILQGAPGTGKTYTAKDIAEQLIFGKISETKEEQKEKLDSSKQYKLIQFHPSYTYEDFVRGIVVETANGQPEYITKNKILANFALRAKESWDLYNLGKENKAKEVLQAKSKSDQFIDTIQLEIDEKEKFWLTDKVYLFEYDDTRFKYKGDNWETHPNGLNMKYSELRKIFDSGFVERSDIKNLSNIESLTSTHATYYAKMAEKYAEYKPKENIQLPANKELQSYVLIIDEINRANLPSVLGELIYALEYRGESVESMYAVEGEKKLMLPPNLYIIGTMNTADRSVGQIDYAIRRRFAFVDMLPHILNDVDGFDGDLFEQVSELFIENYNEYKNNPKATLKRSAHLSEEFRPEDVWLGHSYFIMKKEGKDYRDIRLHYEIKPILKEYLKDGIFKPSAEEIINSLL